MSDDNKTAGELIESAPALLEGQPASGAPAEPQASQPDVPVDVQVQRHDDGSATITLIGHPPAIDADGPAAEPVSLVIDVDRKGAYDIAESLLGTAGSGYFRRVGTVKEG